MSRMGKTPIVPPQGVTITLEGETGVKVKSPKGELSCKHSPAIKIRKDDSGYWVERTGDDRFQRSEQGLIHRLITGMIEGLTKGFKKELEIVGVGYRAAVEGKDLVLSLGFAQPVRYPIDPGIQIKVEKNTQIAVEGIDKQKVGQVAAEIRKLRKPDNYKGKGIRYVGEYVRIKPGKAAVGSGF